MVTFVARLVILLAPGIRLVNNATPLPATTAV